MGAGKSTGGVAAELGAVALDSDALLEERLERLLAKAFDGSAIPGIARARFERGWHW